MTFNGAKLILFIGARVLVIQRDADPLIAFPGLWDFPGGGREGVESPADCVLRETREEIGLALDAGDLYWGKTYQGFPREGMTAVWFAAQLSEGSQRDVRLGEEGQAWALRTPDQLLSERDLVPTFRERFAEFLTENS